MFEKCLFCRGAALLSLLAEQFPKKPYFAEERPRAPPTPGRFWVHPVRNLHQGEAFFGRPPGLESGRAKVRIFSEARPYPACWRSEFPKNAYFAEARPLEPMQSAAAAARGRPQVPKSAAGSGENAPEARFGEAARDFQPKMTS